LNPDPGADIFGQGRQALALAVAAFGGRGIFASARRWQADGTWIGPAEAALAVVDEATLPSGASLPELRDQGANAVLCSLGSPRLGEVAELGMRALLRVPFASGDVAEDRRARLDQLAEMRGRLSARDGIMPVPVGEAQGLETISFFAACRLACPSAHLVVDLEIFGHKLGQLCLSFGADAIMGCIVGKRAPRLGERASSNDLTHDEAALLLRASGFEPCAWLPEGKVRGP